MNEPPEVCISCGQPCVYPIAWAPAGGLIYEYELECRACGAIRTGYYMDHEVTAGQSRMKLLANQAFIQAQNTSELISHEIDAIERGDFWPQTG